MEEGEGKGAKCNMHIVAREFTLRNNRVGSKRVVVDMAGQKEGLGGITNLYWEMLPSTLSCVAAASVSSLQKKGSDACFSLLKRFFTFRERSNPHPTNLVSI